MTQANTPEIAETIHDNPNPSPSAPIQAQTEAPVETPAEAPAVQLSMREQIAARFKEQRAAQEAFDPTAPAADEQPPAVVEDDPPAHVDAPADPDVHTIEPQRYRVKVRGNEFDMSREDILKTAGLSEEEAQGIPMPALVRAAQINAAAQDYLTEAKTALKGSRTAPEPAPTTPAGDEADPEPDPQPTKRGAPDPVIAEAVQRIQFGDPEEAAAALEDVVDKVVQKRDTTRTEQQHRDATQKAVTDFMASNPDIAKNPMGTDLLYVSAMHEIKADLLKIGATPEDVEEAVANPAQAVEAHALARMKGLAVRPPDDILKAAAGRVRTVFPKMDTPTPTPAPSEQQTRTDVKRALTPQPRQATVPAASAPPEPQAKSGSSIVMGMRKQRGQPV